MKRLCALLLTLALTLGLFATAATPIAQAASIFEKGIDVSFWQGSSINWTAVKNSGHGDFAILRAYCSGKDTCFDINYANAKAAGVKVGAYVYIYGTTTAAVQAEINATLEVLKGKKFEYPIYVDIEDYNTYQYVGAQTTTNLVAMACQMITDAGFYPGVYTYTSFAASYIYMNQLTQYTTWIADYTGSVGYSGAYDVWQYGCTGNVGGINPVDVNYSYTDLTSKIIAAGKNGYTAYMQKFDENEKLKYDSGNWKQQYHITTGRSSAANPIDEFSVAQEFRPTDTTFKGVQLYMKVGTSARIKIGIGTTQDNNNMFLREFQVDGNQHEGWYSIDFQREVNLTKGNLYYLFVRIVSSNSYGLLYTNPNSLSSSCPIRAHIRKDGGSWGKTDKCIGFNMLTESGMVRYPFPVNGSTMMLYDGDSISTATTAYATQISCERNYRREGTTSLKMNCTNPVSHDTHTVGGFTYIRLAQSVNLSKYNYLSYQLYLPEDMTSNSRFQVNYTTTGEDGYNSIVNMKGWKAGWHTVTIKKDTIGKAVDSADWTKIYNIRLIWFNDDRVAKPTYFYFDNLRASVDEPSLYPYAVDDTTMMLHDGEQERAFFDGYNTYVYPTTSQVTQGSKSIYMVCTKPTGQPNSVGGMVFLSLDNAVDLSSYETFHFDLYLNRDMGGDVNNPKHKIEIAFSSDDINVGYSDYIYVDGWKAGWYNLKGYFKDCVLRDGQVDRWDAISTVRVTWYNYAQEAGDTRIAVDNFRVTRPSTAAKAVEDAIAALPAVEAVALTDKPAVEAARNAYNQLTDGEKAKVTNLAKLEALEAKLAELQVAADKAAAQPVVDKIAALNDPVTLDDENAVADARGAYDGLTDAQKGYVTNCDKLQKAEADLVVLKDKAAAKAVEDAIDALPTPTDVTVEDEEAIHEAKEAYDALNNSAKAMVPNAEKLEQAVVALAVAKDEAAARKVVEMIDALPTPTDVTVEDEEAIHDARGAYDALSDGVKALLVPDLVEKLEQCEAALVVAKDKAAAKAVEELIEALPTPTDVTAEDESAVLEAEEALNALTETQKGLVKEELKDKLIAVRETLDALTPAYTLGDVNEDGKIDAKDALDVLKASVGKLTLTETQALAAEVDGKEGINANDALQILKYSVKKITKFPIEQ